MCLTGALPLGLVAWGVLSDQFGIRPVTVGSGIAMIAVTLMLKAAKRLDAMDAADDSELSKAAT